jgi:hypothetical protein
MQLQNFTPFLFASAYMFSASSAFATAEGFECHARMTVHGNPNIKKGDFSPAVEFAHIEFVSNMVGFGATGGRTQEITLADSKLFLVKMNQGELETRHKADKVEGAVVLVAGTPKAWKTYGKADGVSSFDGLGFLLDGAVDDMGCDDSAHVPFRITAHANSVTWTVVNGPGKDEVVVTQDVPVTVVGIYSRSDKEHLHMVKGYNFHAHVVIPGQDVAGHIRELDLRDGGTLYLPAQ